MRILYVSENGDCMLDATAMLQQGHEVAVCIRKAGCDYMGLGIVERPDSWKAAAREADMVVVDGFNPTIMTDALEERCDNVIGRNAFCNLVENNREKQEDLFSKVHVVHSNKAMFDTPNLALDLVSSKVAKLPRAGVVLKAVDKYSSQRVVVCKTAQEFIYGINEFPGGLPIVVEDLIDGERVTFVKEMGINEWEPGHVAVVREKSVQMGTTCIGAIGVNKSSKPVRNIFNGLTKFLDVIDYTGLVHVECMVYKDYPVVIDIKFAFDPMISPCLSRLSEKQRYMTGILLTDSTYPHGKLDGFNRGKPIIVKNGDLNGICLQDVYKGDTIHYQASCHGIIALVTGTGRTVRSSTNAAITNMKRINAYESCWSAQGVVNVEGRMKAIVKQGLA